MTNSTTKPQIGAYLCEQSLISSDALHAALLEHKVTHERLGAVLVRRGALSQQALTAALEELDIPALPSGELLVTEIPQAVLLKTRSMVVARTDSAYWIGTTAPQSYVLRELQPWVGTRSVKFVPVNLAKLNRYLENLSLRKEGGRLDDMLARAVSEKVSDIHILPKDGSYSVYFRYLGVRRLVAEGPLHEYATLVAKIKDRARLDIAERRIPQDGAFREVLAGKRVDFRVATVPTLDGEYVVMRVLDPDSATLSLDSLGITRLHEWQAGISRPDGLCLICGPTGSGKTTTLNATIRTMDRFGQSVFTVEDPVEYAIAYTGQVSVSPAVGLTFDAALKAFMRADPDVVVLGEIRDKETAKAAIKMAETGHLVLATLHTESIHGATQRLQDIGVPAYELTYLLRSVLVQRLMRTLCTHCGGQGCASCHQGGYAGRTIVSECAYFPSHVEVADLLAGKRAWPMLSEDALGKVRSGVTDERELRRLFGAEAERLLSAATPMELPHANV